MEGPNLGQQRRVLAARFKAQGNESNDAVMRLSDAGRNGRV